MFLYRSYRHRRRKRLLTTMLLPLLTLLLVLLPFYIIYKPPSLLIRYFQRRWPDVLWQVQLHASSSSSSSSQPLVALTFDDAPSDYTPEILSLLREHDARATFFVIGDHILGREQTLRDVVGAGNELANHAMFDQPSRDLSDDELAAQIQAVQSRIQRIYAAVGRTAEAHDEVHIQGLRVNRVGALALGSTETETETSSAQHNVNRGDEEGGEGQPDPQSSTNQTDDGNNNNNNNNNNSNNHNNHNANRGSRGGNPSGEQEQEEVLTELTPGRYFRPGSGFFTDRMRALVRKEGFQLVLGSVYPHDAQINVPWINAAHVLSMVKPGSIIVVHDRRPWTVPMLAKVLPELKRRGYRVGTVTDLLKEGIST
ncbi:hypothetical protein ARAM_002128 [Aspergillus rambellii]|uniref:chitin deacetylase n=1 Tax=Aspergillus rambellii TaxID=308745 RepID=A0A0F8VJF5_9EURO|nr:hypothetical protein ARAM_002128 [Aspergillus rambellii]